MAAWDSATSATQLTTVTTEQFFSTVVTTTGPEQVVHVQVDVNFPGTTPADATVNVYTTLDASTENWDDTPLMSMLVDKDIDPNAVSFTVSGVYKFRVGVSTSGTALTSADMKYRVG